MENRKPNCSCKECSKPIYRRPHQIESGSVFCSTICSNIRNKTESPSCIVCGIPVENRKRAKTCSRACSNKNRIGVQYRQGQNSDKAVYRNRLKTKLLDIRPNKCNRCPFDFVPILHVHHIVERSNGGTDEFENLELLCPTCHSLHHYVVRTSMSD